MNKNQILNAVEQNLATAPSNPVEGQHYYNTVDKKTYTWNGTEWSSSGYVLTPASSTTLGGVKIGDNLSVENDGKLSVNEASVNQKGVIEIATDTEATDGVSEILAVNPKQLATKLTKNADITGGTGIKITYDSKGLVTSSSGLSASDIPDISSTYIPVTSIGNADGVASLDSNGKVPTEQLPTFVDDVVDSYIVGSTPLAADWLSDSAGGSALTPETSKIYVIVSAGEYLNKTYRWSGTVYVEISSAPGQATESVAGIAKIATTAEITAGTDDSSFVTPAKLASYVAGISKKYTAQNPALSPVGGVCTWTVAHNLGADVTALVKNVSNGERVFADEIYGNNTVEIKINSSTDISANTYKIVVIG